MGLGGPRWEEVRGGARAQVLSAPSRSLSQLGAPPAGWSGAPRVPAACPYLPEGSMSAPGPARGGSPLSARAGRRRMEGGRLDPRRPLSGLAVPHTVRGWCPVCNVGAGLCAVSGGGPGISISRVGADGPALRLCPGGRGHLAAQRKRGTPTALRTPRGVQRSPHRREMTLQPHRVATGGSGSLPSRIRTLQTS